MQAASTCGLLHPNAANPVVDQPLTTPLYLHARVPAPRR
jgi:hypothetical protein